jgi:hypothetical protein
MENIDRQKPRDLAGTPDDRGPTVYIVGPHAPVPAHGASNISTFTNYERDLN